MQGIQRAYETEKNNFTLQLLILINSMVRFGFYRNEEELIEMTDPLITTLDGSLDFVTAEEELIHQQQIELRSQAAPGAVIPSIEPNGERYKLNEVSLNLMSCKNKICDVLSTILDMQNDIRLSRFLI